MHASMQWDIADGMSHPPPLLNCNERVYTWRYQAELGAGQQLAVLPWHLLAVTHPNVVLRRPVVCPCQPPEFLADAPGVPRLVRVAEVPPEEEQGVALEGGAAHQGGAQVHRGPEGWDDQVLRQR